MQDLVRSIHCGFVLLTFDKMMHFISSESSTDECADLTVRRCSLYFKELKELPFFSVGIEALAFIIKDSVFVVVIEDGIIDANAAWFQIMLLTSNPELEIVMCRYNAVRYNLILHTSFQWLRQNMHQRFNPQKIPPISP